MAVRRGEIWDADLGTASGHEQAGPRPVIILQTDQLNDRSPITIVIPVTGAVAKAGYATNIPLDQGQAGLTTPSVALCNHIRALDVRKLKRKRGDLPLDKLSDIEATVASILGLST